jgi:hypothetical protein
MWWNPAIWERLLTYNYIFDKVLALLTNHFDAAETRKCLKYITPEGAKETFQ